MADTKISALTAETTLTGREYFPIVDPNETAAADQNKRVTVDALFASIVVHDSEIITHNAEVVYT